MIYLMVEKGVIDETSVINASYAKRAKLEKWSSIFDEEKGVH
jgi:hypothetical protein